MTTPEEPNAAARDRMIPEIMSAMALADFPIRVWPPDWQEREEVSYFYVSGSILTREQDAPQVARTLRGLPQVRNGVEARQADVATDADGNSDAVRLDRPTPGLARFTLPAAREVDHELDPTADIVDELEKQLGPGIASHEHVFEVTGWVHCPATEPLAVVPPGTTDLARYLWPPNRWKRSPRVQRTAPATCGHRRATAMPAPVFSSRWSTPDCSIRSPTGHRG